MGGRVLENRGNYFPVIAGIVSMLIAPFAWALTPVLYGSGNAAFPFAGPDLNPQVRQFGNQWGLSGNFPAIDTGKLENLIIANNSGEKYMVAVPNAHLASPLILNTGQPVITYGGFIGSEKILNGEKLEQLVASGQLRYIVIGSSNSQQPEINAWVSSHGVPVPDIEWRTPEQVNAALNAAPAALRNMSMKLYDCRK